MLSTAIASNITAPTQFLEVKNQRYAYRRFGEGPGLPLLFLQHFTGTLDNWDPAVTDSLASRREVILFDNAGIGRSRDNHDKGVLRNRIQVARDFWPNHKCCQLRIFLGRPVIQWGGAKGIEWGEVLLHSRGTYGRQI